MSDMVATCLDLISTSEHLLSKTPSLAVFFKKKSYNIYSIFTATDDHLFSFIILFETSHIRKETFPRRMEVLSEVNFDLVALTSGGQKAL